MTSANPASGIPLEQSIKEEARRLGFVLAGFTTPEPPPHLSAFENWLMQGRYASMRFLANDRSRLRRADPRRILPECRSILVLAASYSDPIRISSPPSPKKAIGPRGKVAAYAWGDDYHLVLPSRLIAIVAFIERLVGHPVRNRYYTDTGPVLERDLAQRAGLGWIGKNTLLINPAQGSYFLLAEILLDLELEPDPPFISDHCGKCTRCVDACPTDCILPDRTIDAGRCISYLTIELKDSIPSEMRPLIGDWVFGCDICQMVCPWNRFAPPKGDAAFDPRQDLPHPDLTRVLELSNEEFSRQFRNSPVKRAKRRGYLRNAAVALGNGGVPGSRAYLQKAARDAEPLVREHAAWALDRLAEHDA